MLFGKELALGELTLLADIECGNGPVITHYACPHFAAGAFFIFELDGLFCGVGQMLLDAEVVHGVLLLDHWPKGLLGFWVGREEKNAAGIPWQPSSRVRCMHMQQT